MPAIQIDIKVKEQGKLWLLPPYNYSHRQIAKELDVGAATVSGWRRELIDEGKMKEEAVENNNDLTAEQIFCFVIETATMSERELAEFCRQKYMDKNLESMPRSYCNALYGQRNVLMMR